MSQEHKCVFWPTLMIASAALGAVVVVVAYTRAATTDRGLSPSSPALKEAATIQSQSGPRFRNLSLQPEAFKLSRRLGGRFGAKAEVSVIAGTLRIGQQRELVQITRRQSERGEQLGIALGATALSWSEFDGAKAGSSRATGSVRELVERLAFDSADQFVLAQLRGASYYTIARDVRPAEAGDVYDGPVWTIVRVDDPDRDEERRPQSRWRLYYINSSTQLIDKVVSEIQGQRVEANFSEWTELGGEG
ncbi:MAG: hypothetical protein ACRD8U_05530 [Pyrinomonadaceae bacterium]